MSLPATPTGSRKRHTGSQAGGWGGRESPTPGGTSAGWLGQLGGIVGDILQGWGLLGALRRSGNGSKTSSTPSYGWGSFGGVGSGLGAVGGLGCYSSPASPLVSTRANSLHMSSTGEHIELLPLTGQNPCYLRIEGLGKGGAGHQFGEARLLAAPCWCDACAHLIFTAPVTCSNCGYTCHEQCRPLVAIDCRTRHTPESDPVPAAEQHNSSPGSPAPEVPPQQPLEVATNDVASPDHIDIHDDVQESKELKEKSNDLKSSGYHSKSSEQDFCPSDDDEDNSSDYATLENNHPLTRGSLTIKDGLSTVELQQHLLHCSAERSSGHGSGTVPPEPEKHEAEKQEKDLVNGTSLDTASLRRAIEGLCEGGVAPTHLESWLLDTAAAQGLQLCKEEDGSYRGCLRVHLNLSRPINIVAGTRPPSIYDILKEDRTLDKTLTSFYMPRNAVKAIHITSNTTTREVIVALLRKFKVVDNPQKFALYERSFDCDSNNVGSLRRISDTECPLVLAMKWTAEGLTAHRVVLQENDTADIQWDAFSLPELNNFLRILDREEEDYRSQIMDKYARIRSQIRERLAAQH